MSTATCAVGFLEGDPPPPFESPPPFRVIGTGFLIAPTTILTNRHVEERLKDVPVDRHYLLFAYTGTGGSWHTSYRPIIAKMTFESGPDLSMMEFVRDDESGFAQCLPPGFGNLDGVEVGVDVATCGYLLGNELLASPTIGLERFGPVFLQGHVAAIAPFDVGVSRAQAFLTDLRSGSGLSGSPVFLSDTAQVIGIHYAGDSSRVGRIGVVFPLDQAKLDHLLRDRADMMADRSRSERQVADLMGQGLSVDEALKRAGLKRRK